MFNCGGYSVAEAKYLPDCQGFKNRSAPGAAPWETTGALPNANGVAFGAMVATAPDVAYFLGGYNKDDGFLDSVSRVVDALGTWTAEAALRMNESKSHFCAVHDDVLVSPDESDAEFSMITLLNYFRSGLSRREVDVHDRRLEHRVPQVHSPHQGT